MRVLLTAACLGAMLLAPPASAELLEGFEEKLAGVAEGSSGGPAVPDCSVADLFAAADRPAAIELTNSPPGLSAIEGSSVLLLSTSPLDGSDDDLRQSRWRLVFDVTEPSLFSLAHAFRTEDDKDFGDWYLLALDGQTLACGSTASLRLDDGRSGWMGVGLAEGLVLEPGRHVFEAVVGDGIDGQGRSDLLLDELTLRPAESVQALPPTPCRPAPPEDVGEIPNLCTLPVSPFCTDPLICTSPRRVWTFDDNRFCPNGSFGQDADGDGSPDCLGCSRPEDVGDPNPPGSCFECTDATNRFFEMYVVADCGTEMHLPLNDVESGCISIFDQDRDPVDIVVSNGFDFYEEGGEVCWMAEDCDGGGLNEPGGPGNARTMDVSFTADPSLCGVFVARFRSWAGCIWDLFANCDGTNTQQFLIFDDFCEAEDAYDPRPELIVENLRTTPAADCTVDYCVTVTNIGCRNAQPHEIWVENGTDENYHDVGLLQAGDSEEFCGNLALDPDGPDPHLTRVRAYADIRNDLLECTEDANASSCDAADGGDVVESIESLNCNTDPVCDAGGPYSEECGAGAGGGTEILLDGTGSSDPNDDPLTFAWTTDCPAGSFDDATSATPTLTVPGAACDLSCAVFLTVTDPSDGFSSCEAPVFIDDTLAPLVVCPEDLAAECGDENVPTRDEWRATATGSDGCDPAPVVHDRIVSTFRPCSDSLLELWEFWTVDACGNESVHCQANYEVQDSVGPELTLPPDRLVECPEDPEADVAAWAAGASAEDLCSGPVPVNRELIGTEPGCGGTEVRTYRFTATDACGNVSEGTRTWTSVDNTPPVLRNVPPDVTVSCDSVPSPAAVWADDACDPDATVDFVETREDGDCPDRYVLVRHWTGRDACGNESEAEQRVTVDDLDPPTLEGVPPDGVATCDSIPPPPFVDVTDDCDPDPQLIVDERREDGSCPDEYVLVRTFTGRDRCGNETTEEQRISVRDDGAPLLQGVPDDTFAECNSVPPPASPSATDDCDPAPSVTLTETETPGDCQDSRTLTRTWTATDRCGNATSDSQEVLIFDIQAPVLMGVPPNATVDCDAVPPPPMVQAMDDCDPDPAVAMTELRTDGDCPDEYLLTRTWTATDRCGNASSSVQVLTVVDDTPPSFGDLPPDEVVSCSDVPPPETVSVTDTCDPSPALVFTEVREDGDCEDNYILRRTWTATDRCGNAAGAEQVLDVMDFTAPELVGVPGDLEAGCEDIPPPPPVSAIDDCDPDPTVDFDERRTDGACEDDFLLIRTWTATDRCGNETVAEQVVTVTVTVSDEIPPTLIGVPADVAADCSDVPGPPVVTATDNCDPLPVVDFSESRSDGSCPDEYVLTRTWTGTDRCGNQSTATQRVTVSDTTAPLLAGVPSDATVDCDAVPDPASPTASDDCDPAPAVTFAEVRTDGDCLDRYTLTRTWTATDRCGNASSESQVITVVDEEAPSITGVPADETVECDAVPPPASPSAADNCDPAPVFTFSEVRSDGSCQDEYLLTRTWTATDRCGNASSTAQELTVRDTTAPVLAGVPADITVECDSVPAPAAPTASDNCDPAPVIAFTEVRTDGDCPFRYTLTRTWTATDRCGNPSEEVQVVTVEDTTLPLLTVPGDLTVECPAPETGPDSEAGWRALATATDNCGVPEVFSAEVSRTPGCGLTYEAVFEFWAVDECGNESLREQRTYTVVDTTLPILSAPDDVVVECPAPETGPGSEAEWIASASATDTCGDAEVLTELIERIPGCGNTYTDVVDFWARDDCGNESARERRQYEVVDTTPPVFDSAEPLFDETLWPPNHGYVVFVTGEMASATDACGEVTLEVSGCASSQPEEVHAGRTDDGGNGDGRTFEDCVWEEAGTEFAARAERLGACGPLSARYYSVEITATDECGNSASAVGLVSVEHDRRSHQRKRKGKKLGPNDPPPWPYVHETTYGEGCGPLRPPRR